MAKQRLRLADMAGEDARSEERQGERGKQDKIDQGSLAAARTMSHAELRRGLLLSTRTRTVQRQSDPR